MLLRSRRATTKKRKVQTLRPSLWTRNVHTSILSFLELRDLTQAQLVDSHWADIVKHVRDRLLTELVISRCLLEGSTSNERWLAWTQCVAKQMPNLRKLAVLDEGPPTLRHLATIVATHDRIDSLEFESVQHSVLSQYSGKAWRQHMGSVFENPSHEPLRNFMVEAPYEPSLGRFQAHKWITTFIEQCSRGELLSFLWMSESKISQAALLKMLRHNPSLHSFGFIARIGCQMDAELLSELTKRPNLRCLEVPNLTVDDAGLRRSFPAGRQFDTLKRLSLTLGAGVQASTFDMMLTSCPNLTILELSAAGKWHDAMFDQILQKCKHLTVLWLRLPGLTNRCFDLLTASNVTRQLEKLSFSETQSRSFLFPSWQQVLRLLQSAPEMRQFETRVYEKEENVRADPNLDFPNDCVVDFCQRGIRYYKLSQMQLEDLKKTRFGSRAEILSPQQS